MTTLHIPIFTSLVTQVAEPVKNYMGWPAVATGLHGWQEAIHAGGRDWGGGGLLVALIGALDITHFIVCLRVFNSLGGTYSIFEQSSPLCPLSISSSFPHNPLLPPIAQ